MKNLRIIITTTSSLIVFTLLTAPIFAQTLPPRGNGLGRGVNQQQRLTNLMDRGNDAVTQRIDALNDAIARIQALTRLTDAQKNQVMTTLQNLLTQLNSLKTKIDGDTDLPTMRGDVIAIYNKLRVYLLALPQARIIIAGDRILDVTANMNALIAKLQARINAAGSQASGLTATLTDMQNKVNDANTQAQNAANLVSGLTPDSGDKTVLDSNKQAIQSAREAIKTANSDLRTGFSDARTIVSGLKALRTSPTPTK